MSVHNNDTLGHGYDEDGYRRIGEYFFISKNGAIGRRDRLCPTLVHGILGRSQTTLGIRFADLYSLKMPEVNVTLTVALAITINLTINFSVSNQYGKVEVGLAIRHRTLGDLAFCLFSLFGFENEPFLDFICRENWYTTSLFPSEGDVYKLIKYQTHNRTYTDVLSALNIETSEVAHAFRKMATNIMAHKNVSSDQHSSDGRRIDNLRMENYYNASSPIQARECLAGFDTDSKFDYFLPRAEVIPSEELQQMIFPQVDYWINKFSNKDGVQKDREGPKFLKLLKYLRVVFLQVNTLH